MNACSIFTTVSLLFALTACGDDDGGPGPLTGSDAGTGGGGGPDAGAGGGVDAGGTSDIDAGGGGGADAGGGGEAPDVTISIAESCEDVTPCGGDLLGSWHYTAGCLEDPFGPLYDECPSATVSEQVATARGTITVGPFEVGQDATVHVSARVYVPAECSAGMCELVEASLAGVVDSASCAPESGGCDCEVEVTDSIVRNDTYTISGGILTSGSGERYAFCVDGASLRYQPLDGDRAETYTLTRL